MLHLCHLWNFLYELKLHLNLEHRATSQYLVVCSIALGTTLFIHSRKDYLRIITGRSLREEKNKSVSRLFAIVDRSVVRL